MVFMIVSDDPSSSVRSWNNARTVRAHKAKHQRGCEAENDEQEDGEDAGHVRDEDPGLQAASTEFRHYRKQP